MACTSSQYDTWKRTYYASHPKPGSEPIGTPTSLSDSYSVAPPATESIEDYESGRKSVGEEMGTGVKKEE
ncbi:hypothetical protein HDU93_003215 [Gonapodya sp. JEL0774]|nr:hypothetical protein HDU93_003215 [Gonapodya sp. JEL0774]